MLEEQCNTAYGLLRGQHALTWPVNELPAAAHPEDKLCPPDFLQCQLSAGSVCHMRDMEVHESQLDLPDGIRASDMRTHSQVETGIMCNAAQVIEREKVALSSLVDGLLWRLQSAQHEGLALSLQCRDLERKLHDRDQAWADRYRQLKAEFAVLAQAPRHLRSLALPPDAHDACWSLLETDAMKLQEPAPPTDTGSKLATVLEGKDCADAQRRVQPYGKTPSRDTSRALGGLEWLQPLAELDQSLSKWNHVQSFPEAGGAQLCSLPGQPVSSRGAHESHAACLEATGAMAVTCSLPAEVRENQSEAKLLHARARADELECQVQQLLELNIDLNGALEAAESTISSLQGELTLTARSLECRKEPCLQAKDAPDLLQTQSPKRDETDLGEASPHSEGRICPLSGLHEVPVVGGQFREHPFEAELNAMQPKEGSEQQGINEGLQLFETSNSPVGLELDEEGPCLHPVEGRRMATGPLRQAVRDASSLQLKLDVTEELFEVMRAGQMEMVDRFQRAKTHASSLQTRLEESEQQRNSLNKQCAVLKEDLVAAEQQIVAHMTEIHLMQLQRGEPVKLLEHSQWKEALGSESASARAMVHVGAPTSNTAWETSDGLVVRQKISLEQRHESHCLETQVEEVTSSSQELASKLAEAQISRLPVANHDLPPQEASTGSPRTFPLDPSNVGFDVLLYPGVTQAIPSPAHLESVQQMARPAAISRTGSGGEAFQLRERKALQRCCVGITAVVKGNPCAEHETTNGAFSPVQQNQRDPDPSESQLASDELGALELLFEHHVGVVKEYLHQQMSADEGVAAQVSETGGLQTENNKLQDWQTPSRSAGFDSGVASANDERHAKPGTLNADSVFDNTSMANLTPLGLHTRGLAANLVHFVQAASAVVSSIEGIQTSHRNENPSAAMSPPGNLCAFTYLLVIFNRSGTSRLREGSA